MRDSTNIREGCIIDIQNRAAEILLKINSIHCSLKEPFIFTSGMASPVYIDCRKLISFPRERKEMISMAVVKIITGIGIDNIDVIAGGETAGIPFAAWIAESLSLPMVYVRKKPKGFGRGEQVEGDLKPGERVLLVEDLATDAKSKVNFCQGIKRAGGDVKNAFVIFEYGCYPDTEENLRSVGVKLHALTDWFVLLDVARELNYYDDEQIAEIKAFLKDPKTWSKEHGGA